VIIKSDLNKRAFIILNTILNLKRLNFNINNINIYILKVDDLFNKDVFLFLFNKVKRSNKTEFIKE
jgi:hypothetical protein